MTKIVQQVNTSPAFPLLHCTVTGLWKHDLTKVVSQMKNKTSYHKWIQNATAAEVVCQTDRVAASRPQLCDPLCMDTFYGLLDL
jgi:hypothetical protein